MPKRHDGGSKTILGVTGDLDDRSLRRPARRAAGHPRRSWPAGCGSGSARPALPADTLQRLVAAYGSGRDITALLRALFLDPAFRADGRPWSKQPVEWVVGVFRALHVPRPARRPVRSRAARQAQRTGPGAAAAAERRRLAGGIAWLTTSSLQERLTFAAALARQGRPRPGRPEHGPARGGRAGRLLGVDAWTDRTLAALKDAAADPAGWSPSALVSPEYTVR